MELNVYSNFLHRTIFCQRLSLAYWHKSIPYSWHHLYIHSLAPAFVKPSSMKWWINLRPCNGNAVLYTFYDLEKFITFWLCRFCMQPHPSVFSTSWTAVRLRYRLLSWPSVLDFTRTQRSVFWMRVLPWHWSSKHLTWVESVSHWQIAWIMWKLLLSINNV